MVEYSENEWKIMFKMQGWVPGGWTEKQLRSTLKRDSSIHSILDKMVKKGLVSKLNMIVNGKKTNVYNVTSKMSRLLRIVQNQDR